MEYQMKNEVLEITVSSKGAELRSIQKDHVEYLWQGNPKYWEERSPLLFPYVGRFTEGKYRFKNEEYDMSLHGFARFKEFELKSRTESRIEFRLKDEADTLQSYPFHFQLTVTYELCENRIEVIYCVENNSEGTMYFGIGGHPGFNVPLEEGLAFSDYYLEFGEEHLPERIGHTSACYLSGTNSGFQLVDKKNLPLSHGMFDEDAIVLQDVADRVTLKTRKGERAVTVEYPDLPYLGLWHAPKTEAPYICIEPWTSIPSRQDVVEDLEFKHDLIRLKSDGKYTNKWTLSIQ